MSIDIESYAKLEGGVISVLLSSGRVAAAFSTPVEDLTTVGAELVHSFEDVVTEVINGLSAKIDAEASGSGEK